MESIKRNGCGAASSRDGRHSWAPGLPAARPSIQQGGMAHLPNLQAPGRNTEE